MYSLISKIVCVTGYIPFILWSVAEEQIFADYPLTMGDSFSVAHKVWVRSLW
jgi:hypothetical protein